MLIRQMVRLNGDDNEVKRQIAASRRETFGFPAVPIHEVRLCINCNLSISNEIQLLENDPTCMRLNVMRRRLNGCAICENNPVDLKRLSNKCRVHIFAVQNIYVSENVRVCEHHLDEDGIILRQLIPGLPFINRPFQIKGDQLHILLQGLRAELANLNRWRFEDENSFTDEEFKSVCPITKQNFLNMYDFCEPVPQENGLRYITKRDLITYLCKMKQGISDDFLKVIFSHSSRQAVSMACDKVRQSLKIRFVREKVGVNSITRQNYIQNHVPEFANTLYNPDPNQEKAISYIDGTYLEVEKSSNFQGLRQTFNVHKGYHLLKPILVVAPDGFILTVLGPYFGDGRNNDAATLQDEFLYDVQGLRNFFEEGDIFVVDRGYRDAIPLLQELGIEHRMPATIRQGELQLSVEDANMSRLVTKTRWIIEARNGHLKSIFKFYDHRISTHHTTHLQDHLLICAGIINAYFPSITMQGANAELAQELIRRANLPNELKNRVEAEQLQQRRARWVPLENIHIPDFPHLTLEYLRDLTVGTYQLHLAPSYIQDARQRERPNEIHLDQENNLENLIRIRLFSRFRNATKYQLWIEYNNNTILGYYCTCKSGARTVGTCAHVASITWLLGYARHAENIQYPTTKLLDHVLDARHRHENRMNVDGE